MNFGKSKNVKENIVIKYLKIIDPIIKSIVNERCKIGIKDNGIVTIFIKKEYEDKILGIVEPIIDKNYPAHIKKDGEVTLKIKKELYE